MSNFAKYENLQALFTAIGKKKLSVSDTMPTAGATYEDICILYIGPTDANYTKGYVYECEEVTPSTDPKTYSWNAKINVDVDLSKYKTIFPGTKDEWDLLTEAQQDQYDYCFFDDDESDYFAVVDSITEGDMHPVTSNATYGLKQTVEQNSDAIADISNVYGAKNLLNHDIESGEQSGLTFTVNADRSITVNGTASANLVFTLWNKHDLDSTKQYILSGCPAGGSDSKYELTYTDGGYNHYDDIGSGVKFTPFTTGNDKIFLYIFSGQTFNNAVFKPMLRLASITDGTYEPYTKTNRELTNALEGKADKVSNATNGNFAGLDANGNLTDSGKKASDFQTALTFDNVPTENSNNPVKSNGIYIANQNIYEVMGKNGAKNLIYVEDFTLIKSSARTKSLTTEDFGNDIPKTQVTLSFEVSDSNLTVNGEFRAYAPLVSGVRELLGGVPYMADGTYSFSFDATKLDQLYIFINNEDEITATCKIGNVMIRFANDSDTTYEPYAKTNRQLTEDSVDWKSNSVLGAKNFLTNKGTATTQGVEFAVDSNGVFTVTRKSAGSSHAYYSNGTFDLPAGTYIFSNGYDALPSGIQATYLYNRTDGAYFINCNNGPKMFTLTSTKTLAFNIEVQTTQSPSGVKIYPMIRLVSDNDATYQPYAKTNRELTEAVDGMMMKVGRYTKTVKGTNTTYGALIDQICADMKTLIDGFADTNTKVIPMSITIDGLATLFVRPDQYKNGDNFNIVAYCTSCDGTTFYTFYLRGLSGSGNSTIYRQDVTANSQVINEFTSTSFTGDKNISLIYDRYQII